MNYYKFNIGDYAAATRHLTMLEHGAYRLLLDVYYTTEQPLPVDVKAAARKAGARSKDEIAAVEVVLNEFFALTESGWIQSRCDQEISEYMDGSEERAKKEANEKERMRRHRERRAELFEALRAHGIVPQWDVPMKELQRLHDSKCNTPETRLQRVAGVTDNAPATAIDTNHEPLTINQEPVLRQDTGTPPTRAGAVCVVFKSLGIGGVNPQHPKLLELLADGAQVQEFEDAARKAADAGKGFAYALGIVKNAREDAKRQPVAKSTQAESFRERDDRLARERIESICPSIAAKAPRSRNVIDITGTLTETIGAIA